MSEERETYTAGAPALDLDDIEARCFRVRYNLTQYGLDTAFGISPQAAWLLERIAA